MNRLFTKAFLTVSLILSGLAVAQTPGAFQSVEHNTKDLTTAVDDTWQTYAKSGFTGKVEAMSRTSITYLFHQGERQLLVTFLRADSGVTITTKNMSPVLLTSSR